MHGDRLGDLVADREERIERGHRLLEDHGDLVAADRLHLLLLEIEQVAALEAHGAADDAARRIGNQPQHREGRHALAAAGLPHHAQRLAAAHGVGHPVDGLHHPGRGKEVRLEVFDLEHGRCGRNVKLIATLGPRGPAHWVTPSRTACSLIV